MIAQKTINAAIQQLFENIAFTRKPEGLYDPLRYMTGIGGKRLRPTLCLTAYGLFRDDITPQILEPAAGLEVFHTFTLIHDDMMDKSPLRRGQKTVWVKWNPDTAILSGDVMCIDSYRRMAAAPAEALPRVLDLFSQTAAEVCEGQQYDMEFESREYVPMDEYMTMTGLKTAVLIACSAQMGALIAGAPDSACRALYDYGYKLGLAFQIADDYLDAYGDEKVFGKPIGGDILNAKKSWLTVRAMEKAGIGEVAAALAVEARTDADKAAKIAAVKAIYDREGVAGEAQAEIRRLSREAMEAVAAFDPEQRERLSDFAEKLIGRAK